jgi:DNA-nicking Smr family endonuclease
MKRRPPTTDGEGKTATPVRGRRRLSAEDEALWHAVAGSIEPLARKRSRVPDVEPMATGPVGRESRGGSDKASGAAKRGAGSRAEGSGKPHPSPTPAHKPVAPVPRPTAPPLAEFERRKARRIAAGHTDIQARIDLHGLRQSEAHHRLTAFVHRAAANGLSTVLVITGKGGRRTASNADDFDGYGARDEGVLRRAVPMWLAEPELRALVVSYTSASPRHGGTGALYVHLRRKSRRERP